MSAWRAFTSGDETPVIPAHVSFIVQASGLSWVPPLSQSLFTWGLGVTFDPLSEELGSPHLWWLYLRYPCPLGLRIRALSPRECADASRAAVLCFSRSCFAEVPWRRGSARWSVSTSVCTWETMTTVQITLLF